MDEKFCRLLNADRCSLFIVDEAEKELWTRVAVGVDDTIRLPMTNAGLTGEALTAASVLNVSDCDAHPKFNKSVDQRTGFKTEALIACPVRNCDGEVVAVVEAIQGTPHSKWRAGSKGFTSREQDLLQLLAGHVAVFIDHLDASE